MYLFKKLKDLLNFPAGSPPAKYYKPIKVERRLYYMKQHTKDKSLRVSSDNHLYQVDERGTYRCVTKNKWTKAERKAAKRTRRLKRERKNSSPASTLGQPEITQI